MKIIEIFKSHSARERRKAVTDVLIKYEAGKRKAAEPYPPQETGGHCH